DAGFVKELPPKQRANPPWQPIRPQLERVPQSPQNIPGLLAWWHFNDNFDAQINDVSGNGQHAKLVGGCWHIDGVQDKALMFNGATDYVDFSQANKLNFNPGRSWTISGWVATNQLDAGVILSMRHGQNEAPIVNVLVQQGHLVAKVRSDGNFADP